MEIILIIIAVIRVYIQSTNLIVHQGTFDMIHLSMSQTELSGCFFAILNNIRKK